MESSKRPSLIISIPHSGEQIPEEAHWLKGLPEVVLMCDVDRYVDKIYQPALKRLGLKAIVSPWHRYSGDLNRLPEDVDASTVEGSPNPAGKFKRGFLWSVTTKGESLLEAPISRKTWSILVQKYFNPFHEELKQSIWELRTQGANEIFHLDLHSMPSVGTKEHRDPGEARADFVISDQVGRSSKPEFLDLVCEAYKKEGFQIKVNWPYIGGRITEMYGRPEHGHHTIQVEMNRALYMDEVQKNLLEDRARVIESSLTQVITHLLNNLSTIVKS